jgi:hypothetical protein
VIAPWVEGLGRLSGPFCVEIRWRRAKATLCGASGHHAFYPTNKMRISLERIPRVAAAVVHRADDALVGSAIQASTPVCVFADPQLGRFCRVLLSPDLAARVDQEALALTWNRPETHPAGDHERC